MWRLILALAVEGVVLGIYFFIDGRQTVAIEWRDVVSFGLNPMAVLFFGLTPLLVWWCYRQVYQFAGARFWVAAIWQGLYIQCVVLLANYLAVRAMPTARQFVGLALHVVASLIVM